MKSLTGKAKPTSIKQAVRPPGLWDVKATTFSKQLAHR
jgi:hypothetical protein